MNDFTRELAIRSLRRKLIADAQSWFDTRPGAAIQKNL